MTAAEYIHKLRNESQKLSLRADSLERMREQYPDLEVREDRWGQKQYFSASVLSVANDCQLSYGCGCCTDAHLIAAPFVVFGSEKLLGGKFVVGSGSALGPDIPATDWRQQMEKAGCTSEAIAVVAKHFTKQAEVTD